MAREVVHLDVGGLRFTTTLSILRRGGPECRLSQVAEAGGLVHLDRDGRGFQHVLNYLRDGSLPLGLTPAERLELLREARFWGLAELHELLGGVQAPAEGPGARSERLFARLRYGPEYSERWIVSSPRNLPGVQYELHGACLGRGPIEALNKMTQAGFLPLEEPPRTPPVSEFYTPRWEILMYKDILREERPVREPWSYRHEDRPREEDVSLATLAL